MKAGKGTGQSGHDGLADRDLVQYLKGETMIWFQRLWGQGDDLVEMISFTNTMLPFLEPSKWS